MEQTTFTMQLAENLLQTLKSRFQANMHRHAALRWDAVEARLRSNPTKLWSLESPNQRWTVAHSSPNRSSAAPFAVLTSMAGLWGEVRSARTDQFVALPIRHATVNRSAIAGFCVSW